LVEYTKRPRSIGGSLVISLDKDIREIEGINDENCFVTFKILKVQKVDEITKKIIDEQEQRENNDKNDEQ
jgi:hypothetical protein